MIASMSNIGGYTPVVAVERDLGPSRGFEVCVVPDGALIEEGDLVYFGCDDDEAWPKGICVSDTLFVPEDTLGMICRITSANPANMPSIRGKINITWYMQREEDAIE